MAAALFPQRGGYRGEWAGWGRPIGLRAPGGTPLVTQLLAEPRGKLLPGVCAGDFALLGSVSVWGGDPGQDGPSCRPPAPPPGSGCVLGLPGLSGRRFPHGPLRPHGERDRANSGSPVPPVGGGGRGRTCRVTAGARLGRAGVPGRRSPGF